MPAAVSGAQLPAQVPGGSPAGSGCFAVYGVEYVPGFDDAYISWLSNDKVTWTLKAAGLGPDSQTQISERLVSQEPMVRSASRAPALTNR